jgi:hypothetical protein
MRFGIVIDSELLAREERLVRHAPEFTDLPRKLDGHEQMTVRAFYAEDALLREVVEDEPEIMRRSAAIQGLSGLESRQERIELGRLIAERVTARRVQDERAPCSTGCRRSRPKSAQTPPAASASRSTPTCSSGATAVARSTTPRPCSPPSRATSPSNTSGRCPLTRSLTPRSKPAGERCAGSPGLLLVGNTREERLT